MQMRQCGMKKISCGIGSRQFCIPRIKKLVILSPSLCEAHLRKAFLNEKVETYNLGTKETLAGNRVYQGCGSEGHSPHSLLNYDLDWNTLGLSSIGTRFAIGVHREVKRAADTQHTLIWYDNMDKILKETLKNRNTKINVFWQEYPRKG